MIKFLPTTRMAFRVTLAVFITIIINWVLNFQYPLWSTIPAMYVASSTWGETIEKGVKRLWMTILGCTLGWVFYIITGDVQSWNTVFLILGLFLIIYFVKISYRWSMFFVGFMIVFFMGLISTWDHNMLLLRILQTGIGCVAAIMVSGITFPDYAKKRFDSELLELTGDVKTFLDTLIRSIKLSDGNTVKNLGKMIGKYSEKLQIIKQTYSVSKYEYFFTKKPVQFSKRFFTNIDLLIYITLNFYDFGVPLCSSVRTKSFDDFFDMFQETLDKHFLNLNALISGKQINDFSSSWKPDTESLYHMYIKAEAAGIDSDDLLRLTAIINYGKKLDEILVELINTINESRS
ncbi:MAG: FUSC family protein [bacterium]|nr:FUSC family protein [bacterium]